MPLKTTQYFRTRAPDKHPELREHAEALAGYIATALHAPVEIKRQSDGRTRRWIYATEFDRYLRVIVEPDGETVHNAFFDRNYTRRANRRGN